MSDANKFVDNAGDAIDEAKQRLEGTGEKVKREVAGDSMTFSEKAESTLKEAGHDIKADVDKGKRDLRNEGA